MYNVLACVVLFDARGELIPPETMLSTACVLEAFMLCVCYFPIVFYRPRYVDELCADVIAFAAHAAGIVLLVSNPLVMYGCALHAICFHAHHRFVDRAQHPVLVHTALLLLLVACYVRGPRITDIRQFVITAVAPHALEVAAGLLVHVHRLAVSRLVLEV